MNIYQRISAVMKEVSYIQKTGYNSHFKYSYAKEGDYLASVRPALLKHGLVVSTSVVGVTQLGDVTTAEVKFKLVNVDKPEEYIEVGCYGAGQDKGDKGLYKALTGAKKYFISNTFLIETGDDAEATDQEGKPTAVNNITVVNNATTQTSGLAAVDTPKVSRSAFRRVGAPKTEVPAKTGTDDLDI